MEGQEGITLDQLKALGEANDVSTDIDGKTPIERFYWLIEEVGYYTFSALAVVDSSKLDLISAAGDAVGSSDRSTEYEMFNRVVIAAAEKTIPFYSEGVIEEDPDY